MTTPHAAARPSDVDWKRVLLLGLYGGLAAVLIAAIGLVEDFAPRDIVRGLVSMGYALILAVPLAAGYVAGKPPPLLEGMPPPRRGLHNALAGLLAGLVTMAVVAIFVVIASNFDIRRIFIEVSPRLLDLLTFHQPLATGLLILIGAGAVAGTLGGALHLLPRGWQQPIIEALIWVVIVGLLRDLFFQVFKGVKLAFLGGLLFSAKGLSPLGALVTFLASFGLYLGARPTRREVHSLSPSQQRSLRYALVAVLVVILAILPAIVGRFFSEVLNIVGLYLLMGLGLNIVVGFAGLLDLGYVAFFAVGAYATAVLTSPLSPAIRPELTFWGAIPFVILAAALAGVLVGTPVLRMRGDYLAIVTLGFGEIARILFLSDWFKPVFGGAQGILSIPGVPFGSTQLRQPTEMYYPFLLFALLAAYISWRLADSRIGRAWIAMREDETVAELMGINIVLAKLSAFIIGAILASFGGALFAAKLGVIFPHSFAILVSITVLVAIIVGGMGHIPGVVVGALTVVALPELLREFQEYRLLFYGALLIAMMLLKPEGLIPSHRRARELHEEEQAQDAWIRAQEEEKREARVAAEKAAEGA